jgi:hypothetical protein
MSPTSLIGNLDLVVGTWAGIRDTRLGKLDWLSFSGTDALPPPLILFLKKIRSKVFSLRLTLRLRLVHVRSLRSQVKDSKANHLKFKCRV